jgi:hypothetical protein
MLSSPGMLTPRATAPTKSPTFSPRNDPTV